MLHYTMPRTLHKVAWLLLAIAILPVARGDTSESKPFTIKDRSPLSDPVKICKRTGWNLETIKKQIDPTYDPATETYETYVPADYAGAEPYGLFVWVSAGPRGDVKGDWKEILDKHKLIWIGANNSGNPRAMLVRVGLALDIAAAAKKQYKIDDRRVYVGGVSSGG